jgi:hypothetical protein
VFKVPEAKDFFDLLNLEDKIDVLSTNFGKKLQLYTMYYPGRAQILIQVP